jgi:hypothetical protein
MPVLLAEPGDRVEFRPGEYAVNGSIAPSLPLMPATGSVVLSEKTWMLWPEMRRVSAYGGGAAIPEIVLQLSIISHEQFVGVPFRRWFWRQQTL